MAKKLELSIKDTLILFNVEDMALNGSLKAYKLIVSDIFETKFPEYDKLLSFININLASSIFKVNSMSSGIIINIPEPLEAKNISHFINKKILSYTLISYSWQERHYTLLNWLNIFDTPIKLIMIFISLIALFNLGASIWMIIKDKINEYLLLHAMGLRAYEIKLIIILQGFIIGIIASIFSILLSFILLYSQYKYKIIKLPSEIYFMDSLPVNISIYYFLLYPILGIIFSVMFSCIPAYFTSLDLKNSPLSDE